MAVDLVLPKKNVDPTKIACQAEDLGYERIWLRELWEMDATTKLAEIACRTDHVEIGTAVLNIFSRTPAVLAMTAATLDDISDGRFILGLGTSTRKAIEDLHGLPFENPVRRAHETIVLVKRFLGEEERVDYNGEVFDVAGFPSLDVTNVPVFYAALGQTNQRVVARLCDGWLPHNIPFSELPDAYGYIVDHLPDKRDTNTITVAPYVPAVVHENREYAENVLRQYLAYYIGNGTGYQNAVATRFPQEADSIATAWYNGNREAANKAVTSEMVSELGIAGRPEEARMQLLELLAKDVIDRVLMVPAGEHVGDSPQNAIEALAPRNF